MIATKVEPSHEKSLNSHTAESGQALVFSVIVTDSLPAGFTANTVSEWLRLGSLSSFCNPSLSISDCIFVRQTFRWNRFLMCCVILWSENYYLKQTKREPVPKPIQSDASKLLLRLLIKDLDRNLAVYGFVIDKMKLGININIWSAFS